jgi:transcriptional regulator with XRE-family HTH domain
METSNMSFPGQDQRRRIVPFDRSKHLKMVGERLKQARLYAGMQQIEAAQQIGYKAATQLNEAEAGKRMLDNNKLIPLARLYGTTMDYLLGLTDDPDSDPVASAQRRLTDFVTGRFVMLARAMAERNIDAVRKMSVDTGETLRLSELVLEIDAAMTRVRQAYPALDQDVRGLGSVVLKLQTAADRAQDAISRHARAHRAEMHRMQQVSGDLFGALKEGESFLMTGVTGGRMRGT